MQPTTKAGGGDRSVYVLNPTAVPAAERVERGDDLSPYSHHERGVVLHVLLFTIAVLLAAAVFGAAGFAIGYGYHSASVGGGQSASYSPTALPQPVDVEVEVHMIEQTCTEAELTGASDEPPSPGCLALVTDRIAAVEALIHAGHAGEPAASSFNSSSKRARRWWWDSSDSSPNCDGTWDDGSSCCRNNRPGGLTGPSPICRAGMMNSDYGDQHYYCSWYNPICLAFCSSYDEVQYCGYFGLPN